MPNAAPGCVVEPVELPQGDCLPAMPLVAPNAGVADDAPNVDVDSKAGLPKAVLSCAFGVVEEPHGEVLAPTAEVPPNPGVVAAPKAGLGF